VSGDRHHFFQASLLGGFGRTPAGKKQRDADIELRRTGSVTTETTTPDDVGWVDKLYRSRTPAPESSLTRWTSSGIRWRTATATR
jgi:hypothetical protein